MLHLNHLRLDKLPPNWRQEIQRPQHLQRVGKIDLLAVLLVVKPIEPDQRDLFLGAAAGHRDLSFLQKFLGGFWSDSARNQISGGKMGFP